MSETEILQITTRIDKIEEIVTETNMAFKLFNDVFLPALTKAMEEIHSKSPCRQDAAIIKINKRLSIIEKTIGITV